MIQKLLELMEVCLKEKLDGMKDNYERAEWLAAKFKEVSLPESLQYVIIKWFLNSY